jgi:hypothetical protein
MHRNGLLWLKSLFCRCLRIGDYRVHLDTSWDNPRPNRKRISKALAWTAKSRHAVTLLVRFALFSRPILLNSAWTVHSARPRHLQPCGPCQTKACPNPSAKVKDGQKNTTADIQNLIRVIVASRARGCALVYLFLAPGALFPLLPFAIRPVGVVSVSIDFDLSFCRFPELTWNNRHVPAVRARFRLPSRRIRRRQGNPTSRTLVLNHPCPFRRPRPSRRAACGSTRWSPGPISLPAIKSLAFGTSEHGQRERQRRVDHGTHFKAALSSAQPRAAVPHGIVFATAVA